MLAGSSEAGGNGAAMAATAAAGPTRLRADQIACLQTIHARASRDAQGAAEQLSLWILPEHRVVSPRREEEPGSLGVERDI
eukprot:4844748-Lingulodinium_polyedra.AAC.1